MNDSPSPQPPSTTVGELIAESGRTASPRVADFLEFAMGAQRALQGTGAHITGGITRSAALWALMRMDDEIARALEEGGISLDRFSEILSITKVSRYQGRNTAEVHDDFASALRTYLRALPRDRQVVDLVDIAIAIMQSDRVGSGGLLWRRLSQMTISYEHIMSSLASAIAELHPEYAGGQLGTVGFRQLSSEEASRTWPDWYAAVARWFDGDALARAGHEVLDGRLLARTSAVPARNGRCPAAGAWCQTTTILPVFCGKIGSL
jgi:hypothetical protein